jgi:4-hydroxybenzoate polyprenyltransferase
MIKTSNSLVGSWIVNYLVSVLRFYRVSDWLHFLGFALLGVILADQLSPSSTPRTIMILASSAGLLAYAYSLNDSYDRELEYSHCNDEISGRGSNTSRALFVIIPLVGSLILLSQFSIVLLAFGILFSMLWTMYSYPVPKLKAIPVVCTVVNGVGFPVLFLIGFAATAAPNLECTLIFLALVLLEIPAQLIHEICHAEEDRMFQVCTTAVRYGEKRAIDAAVLGLLGVVVLCVYTLDQGILGLATSLVLLLFPVTFALRFELARARKIVVDFAVLRRQYKYAGIIAGAAMGVLRLLHL